MYVWRKFAPMKITDQIHLLKHNFLIPVSPDKSFNRFVYSLILFSDEITLIDSGVKGSYEGIFAYILKNGRSTEDITRLILSHSHPDHIGSAAEIKARTGCVIMAHEAEKVWIENISLQNQQRPVPGFFNLVDRSVTLDHTVTDNEEVRLGLKWYLRVIHTPGHSKGSLSFHFPNDKLLFTADAVPLENDIPNYDNYFELMNSINTIRKMSDTEILLSSWAEPAIGNKEIQFLIAKGEKYIENIHQAVMQYYAVQDKANFENCQNLINSLGLPAAFINPLAHRAFLSHLEK
jgi:hydroxyacylglutathione hydrolase